MTTAPLSMGGPSIVTTVRARTIIRFSRFSGIRQPTDCTLPDKAGVLQPGSLTPGDLKPLSGHIRDQIFLSVTLLMQSLPLDRVSIRWFADIRHRIGRSPRRDR